MPGRRKDPPCQTRLSDPRGDPTCHTGRRGAFPVPPMGGNRGLAKAAANRFRQLRTAKPLVILPMSRGSRAGETWRRQRGHIFGHMFLTGRTTLSRTDLSPKCRSARHVLGSRVLVCRGGDTVGRQCSRFIAVLTIPPIAKGLQLVMLGGVVAKLPVESKPLRLGKFCRGLTWVDWGRSGRAEGHV